MSWTQTRLRYVADLNPPVRPDLLQDPSREVSFLPMEAVGENGSLDLERTRPVAEVRNGYSYFEDGDVAIAKVTPCFENGKGALMRGLTGGAGFGTTELTVLRPRSGVEARFLRYLLASAQFMAEATGAMTGAGGLKRVPDWFVRDYSARWPDTSTQERIANFLDEQTARIDALIAEKLHLSDRLVEYRKSVITEAVTKGRNPAGSRRPSGIEWLGDIPAHWKMTKLKYLGKAITGLTYSPSDVVQEGEGVLVLRSSNVQSGRLSFSDCVYVAADIPEELRTRRGDLLICSRNGSRALIGKNAMIDDAAVGLTFGAFMTVFRSEFNEYLSWVLNSHLFDYHSSSFLTSTINQLTIGNLNSLEVPTPPSTERQKICDYLAARCKQMDALSAHAQEHIDRLREYRSSLISAAVTGQIDVGAFNERTRLAA